MHAYIRHFTAILARSTFYPRNFRVQPSISFSYCYSLAHLCISLVASKYFGASALKLSLLREWPISHYMYIIQKTTMPKSCAIYQCSATSENKKNLSFHQFPTDPKLRRAILLLRHMYVPFISLKRISTRAASA